MSLFAGTMIFLAGVVLGAALSAPLYAAILELTDPMSYYRKCKNDPRTRKRDV